MLRAAGFKDGDIADAMMSEGAALSTVANGRLETVERLRAMGRHIQERANG